MMDGGLHLDCVLRDWNRGRRVGTGDWRVNTGGRQVVDVVSGAVVGVLLFQVNEVDVVRVAELGSSQLEFLVLMDNLQAFLPGLCRKAFKVGLSFGRSSLPFSCSPCLVSLCLAVMFFTLAIKLLSFVLLPELAKLICLLGFSELKIEALLLFLAALTACLSDVGPGRAAGIGVGLDRGGVDSKAPECALERGSLCLSSLADVLSLHTNVIGLLICPNVCELLMEFVCQGHVGLVGPLELGQVAVDLIGVSLVTCVSEDGSEYLQCIILGIAEDTKRP